jgi:hypothetical protein
MIIESYRNLSCVYKITCGSYFYIGSTIDMQMRKTKHLNDLKNKNHGNKNLQDAYNAIGHVTFIILTRCRTEDVKSYEQEYLDYYANDPKLLNLSMNAYGPSECKYRISVIWDGVLYDSISDFSRATGIAGTTYHKARKLGINNTKDLHNQSSRYNTYYCELPNGKKIAFENAKHCLEAYGLGGSDVSVSRINRNRLIAVHKITTWQRDVAIEKGEMIMAPRGRMEDLQVRMISATGRGVYVTELSGRKILFNSQKACAFYYGLNEGEGNQERLLKHVQGLSKKARDRIMPGNQMEYIVCPEIFRSLAYQPGVIVIVDLT